MDSPELINRLADWYADQCDGDWEHEFGVTIETLDNPGWLIKVDLSDTDAEGTTLEPKLSEFGEGAWIHVAADGSVLRVACSPRLLDSALKHVLSILVRAEGGSAEAG